MINLTKNIITSIMAEKNYGVCYEPIIKLSNMDVVGYEALSRFKYQGVKFHHAVAIFQSNILKHI